MNIIELIKDKARNFERSGLVLYGMIFCGWVFILLSVNGLYYNKIRLLDIGEYAECKVIDCKMVSVPVSKEGNTIDKPLLTLDCTKINVEPNGFNCDGINEHVIVYKSEKLGTAEIVKKKSFESVILQLFLGGFKKIIFSIVFIIYTFIILTLIKDSYLTSYRTFQKEVNFKIDSNIAQNLKSISDALLLLASCVIIILIPVITLKFSFNFENTNLFLNGLLFLLIQLTLILGPIGIILLYISFLKRKNKWVKIIRNVAGILTSLRIIQVLVFLLKKSFYSDFKPESFKELTQIFLELLVKL